MKKAFFTTILAGFFTIWSFYARGQEIPVNADPVEITVEEAINSGSIELMISGAYETGIFKENLDYDGIHYGKCMVIVLKSKVDRALLLRLDCGTQLIPNDTTVQTMIVTHEAIFALNPNEVGAYKLYAMCGQLHDAAPSSQTLFKIGGPADSNVVKLANYLSYHYIQNMIGQHALWAYTDSADTTTLKNYGAGSISLAQSAAILNALHLTSKLNPPLPAAPVVLSNDMVLNKYVVYAVGGVIVVLVLAMVARKRRKVA